MAAPALPCALGGGAPRRKGTEATGPDSRFSKSWGRSACRVAQLAGAVRGVRTSASCTARIPLFVDNSARLAAVDSNACTCRNSAHGPCQPNARRAEPVPAIQQALPKHSTRPRATWHEGGWIARRADRWAVRWGNSTFSCVRHETNDRVTIRALTSLQWTASQEPRGALQTSVRRRPARFGRGDGR